MWGVARQATFDVALARSLKPSLAPQRIDSHHWSLIPTAGNRLVAQTRQRLQGCGSALAAALLSIEKGNSRTASRCTQVPNFSDIAYRRAMEELRWPLRPRRRMILFPRRNPAFGASFAVTAAAYVQAAACHSSGVSEGRGLYEPS